MDTVRKVIEKWKDLVEDKSGFESDETPFSDYAVYHDLVLSRSVIIKDRDRPGYFTENMFQTLPCIMFEEVDSNECGIIPPSGCIILKSTCEIPNVIKVKTVSKQLGQHIDFVRWDRVNTKKESRIDAIKNQSYASIRNINGKQYLYILNDTYLKNAVLEAIFEDPIVAAQFCGDKEALCNPMELNFHTDYKLIDPIVKLSIESKIKTRAVAGYDRRNDDHNPDQGEVK